MVRLEAETDIERLRQTAILLQSENDRLHRRLVELTRSLAVAEGRVAEQLELELAGLKEQLAQRNRLLFGDRSEKRPRERKDPQETEKRQRRGHGPRPQPELPIVEKRYELDEADRVCNSCGGELLEWAGQFEESEEIDVVEREFRVVKQRRQKYRCTCGGCVDTALGPPKLVSGGRYSVDFAISVAIAKYADHLPLARQVKQMERQGLRIDTQTLWDQLFLLSRHLEPTYDGLHAQVLSSPVIGADETTWRLMGKGKTKKWWVWGLSSVQAVYYRLQGSRSAEAARNVLGEYRGIVVADGYSAYGSLKETLAASTVSGSETFRLANCWAHARRKFVDAEASFSKATEMLDLLRDLYRIEHRGRAFAGEERLAALARMRQEESRPLLKKIREWLLEQRAKCLPKSSLGKAISYSLDLWPGLEAFVDDPQIPIDNNGMERALRGAAIGRKNHYGSRSERGTRVAALFYSLIESAKLYGHEPAYYLRQVTYRAIAEPGTTTLPRDLPLRPRPGDDSS